MAKNPDRILIKYTLTFDTLFHFGTGIREALIDRTVVRDSKGYLYVPGSTFKGVLRERCEQLARFYESQAIESPHDAEAALLELGNLKPPTMIRRIFGSQVAPGKLFFDNARQDNDALALYDSGERDGKGKYKELQVDAYTQVKLARPTHTAVQGALYTSEFGRRDMVFNGSIQGWLDCSPIEPSLIAPADTVPTYSLLLLLAGIQLVDRLGGNKSAGKGKCKCEIGSVEVKGKKCDEWHSWLHHLDLLTDYSLVQEVGQ